MRALPITCSIDQKFSCGGPRGCEAVSPGRSYNLIDEERQTFSRCDDRGCDEYPAIFTPSGAFTYITFAPTAFAKLSNSNRTAEMAGIPPLQFQETASSGLGVLVSFGTCSRDMAGP